MMVSEICSCVISTKMHYATERNLIYRVAYTDAVIVANLYVYGLIHFMFHKHCLKREVGIRSCAFHLLSFTSHILNLK